MINRSFMIKDVFNRNWGTFTVKNTFVDYFGEEQIQGFLEPTSSFKEVSGIFLNHESQMSETGDAEKTNWKEIVDLGSYLVDNNSGECIDIGGVIFIGKNLLVTCGIKKNR